LHPTAGQVVEQTGVVTSFVILPEILRATDPITVAPRRLVMDREGPGVRVIDRDPGLTKVAAWHVLTTVILPWMREVLFSSCTARRGTLAGLGNLLSLRSSNSGPRAEGYPRR
jgi:hypothetical protein